MLANRGSKKKILRKSQMKALCKQPKLKWIASAILTGGILMPNIKADQSSSASQGSIPQPSWQLSTDDTCMTIAVANNRPAIYGLTNPAQGWNWTPAPADFPLLRQAAVGNAGPQTPDWKYRDAAVDESNGTKVTLRFTSTTPKLELKSIWWARKGPGPVEQWMVIENQTGDDLTINGQDVVSADMPVVADNPVTLWRFNKTPRGGGPDAKGFCRTDVGVFVDKLGANASIQSAFGQVGNLDADGELPFEIFDVGSTHGLYIGYNFGYGKFVNTTAQDPLHIGSRFYLDDGERIKVDTRTGKYMERA